MRDAIPRGKPTAQPDPITVLRRTHAGYQFTREPGNHRGPSARDRYIALATRPGLHPHTVVTPDLDELRAALAQNVAPANRW